MEQNLQTIIKQGILPLTSECNTACLFCSHRFNPKELQVFSEGPLSLAELQQALPIIQRLSALTIGESITTTTEGEPLTHLKFLEILRTIRQAAPEILLRITTNGILLDSELIEALRLLQPVELTISLNSVDPVARRSLMGRAAADIRPLLPLLAASLIPWHASLVAMPQVVGEADVLQTVEVASRFGARSIRIFWPGFTKQTPAELLLPPDTKRRTELLLNGWADNHQTPLLMEPIHLDDLRAEVVGVIAATPASRAGVARGDVVLAINAGAVQSRTDAFWLAYELADPEILLERQGVVLVRKLSKAARSSSGLTFYGDLSPGELARLHRYCRRNRGRVYVLTSHLAAGQLRAALADSRFNHVAVLPVDNQTFGGSIECAGLLTVSDFAHALQKVQPSPDLVLLPRAPFDEQGHDLFGIHYRQLSAYCRQLMVV